MLGENTSEPALFQMVDLESLVPEGHRLRQCLSVGMVSGRHASVDGTRIHADASMESLKR